MMMVSTIETIISRLKKLIYMVCKLWSSLKVEDWGETLPGLSVDSHKHCNLKSIYIIAQIVLQFILKFLINSKDGELDVAVLPPSAHIFYLSSIGLILTTAFVASQIQDPLQLFWLKINFIWLVEAQWIVALICIDSISPIASELRSYINTST